MNSFFVGQRVRLVKPTNPKNYGIEGRIHKFKNLEKGTIMRYGESLGIYSNCLVDYVVKGICADHTDRLEPIIPSGMEPVAWEDCLWNPSMIKEVV